MFAQGAAVLNARGDWLAELADIVAQYERSRHIDRDAAAAPTEAKGRRRSVCARRRETIKERFPECEIRFWDERFTTTIAQQALLEADVSRSGRKKKVDKIAATLLLQSYLDSGRNI